ncbi:MAG: ABC transporter substrate-binding protein [Candidatus Tectomicrobia bacterium]|uniref:ABC transporter substrate-binding protein n=1 Tax=Tectimicrobiota bacterium TaxID=2528274 RepID=A0A932HWQ9_UNCTE|nr:ABC transporter substrate-binding protein [Candidatus Tectomicrobia bacterium]
MNRIAKWFIGIALAGGMLAPGWSAEGAEKFRIGIHRAIMGSFEVIADRKGYWKEEGLDYTVQYFKQGKLMRNAVISGDLDTGTTGFSPFVTAVSKGAKVTGIAVTTEICATSGRIMVPKDSPIKSVKDLKGVTFATLEGTSTDFAFRTKVLPRYGLKADDLKWLNVVATDRVAAVVSGNAGAALIGDPQAEIAVQKGLVRELENVCEYDRTRMMHIGNPQTLKTKSVQYEKYFRGWLKAHKLLKENPEEFAKVYHAALQEVGDKTEYKVVLSVIKRLPSTPLFTDVSRKDLQDMAKMQIKLGYIKKHPDFTKGAMMDDSIVRKVAGAPKN